MAEDMEAILDGVQQKLIDELDAQTAAVNAEHEEDAFEIERVPNENILISTRAEIPYPSIMVLPDRGRPEADMGVEIIDYGPVFRPEPKGLFVSSIAVLWKIKQSSQFQ
jgi:hypothetical protein